MNNSEKFLQGTIAFDGNSLREPMNAPSQYVGRNKQYMGRRTQEFNARRAYLSSDYISAEVQGLTDDFYEYSSVKIRMSDLATMNKTSLVTKKIDDYKEVLIPDSNIDYLPIGAKINAMGSVWIVTNPSNIASVNATAVVARCNATYSFYDDYGNVRQEPIVVERVAMDGNKNIDPLNMVLMSGYFNVICQLNENTEKLSENSRIILGKRAYAITGYADFSQEFSGDLESCHYCTFTIRTEEPTERDDIVNKVADGLPFPFSAKVDAPETIEIDVPCELSAQFLKCGDLILPTEENPQTWIWESSDPDSIEIVEEDGVFYAVGKIMGRTARISATLRENPKITAFSYITAEEDSAVVSFIGETAEEISQYDTEGYTAKLFVGGIPTGSQIVYEFSGADKQCYSLEYEGESVFVTCLMSSETPLKIKAVDNESGLYAEISVNLYGY